MGRKSKQAKKTYPTRTVLLHRLGKLQSPLDDTLSIAVDDLIHDPSGESLWGREAMRREHDLPHDLRRKSPVEEFSHSWWKRSSEIEFLRENKG